LRKTNACVEVLLVRHNCLLNAGLTRRNQA
jgi:hypothetical protein